MSRRMLAVGLLGLGLLSGLLQAQQELNNAAVVKMVKAGLSAEIVAATVNGQPGHYDVSADGLIALKKAGVGDQVISAMIAHASGGGASGPAAGSGSAGAGAPGAPAAGSWGGGAGGASGATPAGSWGSPAAGAAVGSAAGGNAGAASGGVPAAVDSVGVYYRGVDGNWSEVGAEVVNFKTGGALKHLGSAGIVKGDLNGHVAGFHSRLGLKMPAEFMVYVPEGVSPGEYQLIHFRVSSESREFRSLTGGVAHTSGGAGRDTLDFTTRKIAPRVYAISLGADVAKGEYGFLPPVEGSGGKSITSSGKVYTFSVGD